MFFFVNSHEMVLKSAISRQAKASKFSLVLWLNEMVRKQTKVFGHLEILDEVCRDTF